MSLWTLGWGPRGHCLDTSTAFVGIPIEKQRGLVHEAEELRVIRKCETVVGSLGPVEKVNSSDDAES